MRVYPRFDLLGSPLLALCGVGLLIAEALRPRRSPTRPRWPRYRTQLALGALSAAAERAVVVPALVAVAELAERRRWGLFQHLPLGAARSPLELLALDLGMYAWHRMSHQLGPLWRLHAVHHTDLALDITTAPRLHVGELLASIPVRSAQVLLLGARPRSVLAYELLMQAAALFHHANLASGDAVSFVLMTPGLHTRHHAAIAAERDVNWGIVLSVWDRLFGTYAAAPACDPRLGTESARSPLGAFRLWALPFRESIR